MPLHKPSGVLLTLLWTMHRGTESQNSRWSRIRSGFTAAQKPSLASAVPYSFLYMTINFYKYPVSFIGLVHTRPQCWWYWGTYIFKYIYILYIYIWNIHIQIHSVLSVKLSGWVLSLLLACQVSGTTGSSACPGLLAIPVAEMGAVGSATICNSSNI